MQFGWEHVTQAHNREVIMTMHIRTYIDSRLLSNVVLQNIQHGCLTALGVFDGPSNRSPIMMPSRR